MSLWSAFGELWGWLSDEKPDQYDVLPPNTDTTPGERVDRYKDKLSRNGGTDQEGAFSNYWDYPGFYINPEALEALESGGWIDGEEWKDDDDWEDNDGEEEED
jgi:hypothetical protein